MADPTVNWITGEITVPKSYMTLLSASPEIYELDVDVFRLKLRDLEDDPDGRPWPKTHLHNTEYTIAGVTYIRAIQIIDPYFITFENGMYVVNLTAANNNIFTQRTYNNVSVNPSNSAGLQIREVGSGLDAAQDARLTKIEQSIFNRRTWDKNGNTITIYDADNVTPLYVFDTNSDLSDITPQ